MNSRSLISLSNVQNIALINSNSKLPLLSAHKQRAFNAAWSTAVSTLFTIFTSGVFRISEGGGGDTSTWWGAVEGAVPPPQKKIDFYVDLTRFLDLL